MLTNDKKGILLSVYIARSRGTEGRGCGEGEGPSMVAENRNFG